MVTSWEQVSAKMMSKNAQVRSKLLEIARILWLVSARTQICVLTVCQQQRWQVLEHCANSRIRAGVGPKSVLTVDVSVLTLERRPCLPAAAWKALGSTTDGFSLVRAMVLRFWATEQALPEWEVGLLKILPKKGDRSLTGFRF